MSVSACPEKISLGVADAPYKFDGLNTNRTRVVSSSESSRLKGPSMRHRTFQALLLGVAALILADRANAQPPRPFLPGAWWKEYQKPLGLSTDQSERIDKIFQDSRPHLRHQREQLDAAETELSRLIEIGSDDVALTKQSDRVESIRASLNKERTMMLVHMRAILTPEQRAALNALRDQWDRDHLVSRAR